MKNWFKNFFLVFVLLLLVSSLFSLTDKGRVAKTEEISLSELAREVVNEKVKSIVIEGNELTIIIEDNVQKKALKETDISLTTSLKNFGASDKQLQRIDIREKNPSGLIIFATTFLPIILPFLLIGIFVWLMLKQAKKGQHSFSILNRERKR